MSKFLAQPPQYYHNTIKSFVLSKLWHDEWNKHTNAKIGWLLNLLNNTLFYFTWKPVNCLNKNSKHKSCMIKHSNKESITQYIHTTVYTLYRMQPYTANIVHLCCIPSMLWLFVTTSNSWVQKDRLSSFTFIFLNYCLFYYIYTYFIAAR